MEDRWHFVQYPPVDVPLFNAVIRGARCMISPGTGCAIVCEYKQMTAVDM